MARRPYFTGVRSLAKQHTLHWSQCSHYTSEDLPPGGQIILSIQEGVPLPLDGGRLRCHRHHFRVSHIGDAQRRKDLVQVSYQMPFNDLRGYVRNEGLLLCLRGHVSLR